MKLPVSDSLSLPANAVTQKIAFIGRTGSGKTYGAGKMVECMLDAEIQVVILDPVGVWYGLRLLADGKSPGYPIPVFGGLKGDIPLEPTGGALVADLIVDRGISIVLDVSQFESDADKARFATDFASRFFFRKKAAPSAVHLVIEECQEFIPQNPMKGEERMLHAFQRMWKLGRNFGIGGSLITQRPQEVSKKALNQTEAPFVFQMTGPQERKAIELWLSEKGIDPGLADELPSLKIGQCHVWSPQWLKISEKIHIGTKKTFNSSSTPGSVGSTRKQELAPIDLANLQEKMKETIERAKADDPRALRAEIARLKAVKPVTVPSAHGRDVASDRYIKKLVTLLQETMKIIATINAVNFKDTGLTPDQIEQALKVAAAQIGKQMEQKLKESERGLVALQKEATRLVEKIKALTGEDMEVSVSIAHNEPFTALPAPQRASVSSNGTSSGSIGNSGLRRMMIALAQRPGLNKRQLGVRAGMSSGSGTFGTYMGKLRSNGWLSDNGSGFELTAEGLKALGPYEPLPEGRDLLAYWLSELGNSGASRILRVLSESYPDSLGKEELGRKADISSASGTFGTYLGKLRSLELIEGRGELRASEELFN